MSQLPDRIEEPQSEAKLRSKVRAGFTLAIILTCLLSFLSWRMAQQANADADWVAHTHGVLTTLEATLRHLVDVETGVRGFALTGSEPFLQPYETGKAAAGKDLRRLRLLVADNSEQTRRLDTLEAQANARIDFAANVVVIRQNTRRPPTAAQLEQGKQAMDTARATITAMEDAEKQLLEQRTGSTHAAQRFHLSLIALGALAGLIFLSAAGATVNREIGISARARRQVISLNVDLERRVEQRTAALQSEIAARREIEARLRSSEEIFRVLLDGIKDYAVYMLDAEGQVVSWNSGAARINGYLAEEIIGQHVSCFYTETDREHHLPQETLQKAAYSGRVEETGWRVRKDGSKFWANAVITSLYEANGALRGYSKVVRDITDRKLAEAALSESEGRLAGVIASAMDSIITIDEEQRIVLFNGAAERTFLCPGSEAIGQPITRFIPQRFHGAHAGHIHKFGEAGVTNRAMGPKHVLWAVRADGLEFQIEASISQVVTGGKKLFTAILRDVTERVRAEAVKEHLAAVVDFSDDAIISKDLDGRINAWNRGAEKIFGYPAAEVMGQPMRTLFPPDRVNEESGILERIRRGESIAHFETVRVRKDGKHIDVSVTISPIWDGNGAIVGASKIARDITARKQAEEKLARQAEELQRSQQSLETQTIMLQSVLDSINEGVVAADENGKFILWNAAATRIVGMGAENVTPGEWNTHYGVYLPDTITPLPDEQNPLSRAIQGNVSTAEVFLRNEELEQGTWLEIGGGPLRGRDGSARGGVVAFRDITHKKAAEMEIRKLNQSLEERIVQRTAQLEAANHDLESFTYSVSHDLRAPLRHIMGFAGACLEEFGATLDPQALHYLQRIQTGTRRMGLLTDELLNLARTGQRPLRVQLTELNAIVEDILSMLKTETQGREVEWKISDLPSVECDPVLIRQVFQNLLSNAIKYSRRRPDAVIEVGHTQENGQRIIFVRDNGAGFDMQYADKLFGVFQRLHREEEFEGTGVGLATVHRIVQKHGGRIWAEAELDHGATFYFTLGDNKSDAATAATRS